MGIDQSGSSQLLDEGRKMEPAPKENSDTKMTAVEYTPPDYWEGSAAPVWLQRLVTNGFVFMVTHYNLWLLPLLVAGYYLVVQGALWLIAVAVALYLPSYLSQSQSSSDGRQWNAFRALKLWNLVSANYLRTRVIRETPLDSGDNKRYVFAYSPHGILVLSRFAIAAGNWEKLFPDIDFRFLGASAIFSVPLAREACLWLGGVDASRSTAEKVLKSGKSITVYPGGVPEIFLTDPKSKENVLVLKKRRGFIKLAMREAADLVPVFVFGEKWLYNVWTPSHRITSFFWRTIQVPMIFFWGRVLWMPMPPPEGKSFGVVYGKPLSVPSTQHPTDEQVHVVQEAYVAEVERLFHQYKKSFGYDDDETLVIT